MNNFIILYKNEPSRLHVVTTDDDILATFPSKESAQIHINKSRFLSTRLTLIVDIKNF